MPVREAPPHEQGHRGRLRSRLLNAGGDALHDYELLELYLFLAIPRKDVKPIAKALIARFGDLGGVATAPLEQLVQVEGVARAIDPRHDIWKAAEPIVKTWIAENFGPAGAARLAVKNIREVADRLKRLPEVMDRFEASLEQDARQTAEPKRTGPPWWAWFGLVIVLAAIAGVTVAQFA